MRAKVKTIDLQAKEWFDKANGNSYFSCEVIVNFGLKGEFSFYIPMTYGYGSHYQDVAFNKLKSRINQKIFREAEKMHSLWRFCNENGIVLRSNKQENCLKREL